MVVFAYLTSVLMVVFVYQWWWMYLLSVFKLRCGGGCAWVGSVCVLQCGKARS